MLPEVARRIARFDAIDLESLNARAAMMERQDNKYIVPVARLCAALEVLRDGFDVLEIGGMRCFGYATRYFDDPLLRAYHDHHQGRRKRSKIRARHYEDAGLTFLEVKLKDRRDITIKKRMPLDRMPEVLDAACARFIDRCHADAFGAPLARNLRPAIAMRYERITLVAREGGERLTLDTRLIFHADGQSRAVSPELFIIETKSANGNGQADKVLRGLHLHPTTRVSKYCVAMAAMGQVARANRFLPALRRLDLANPAARTA